MRGTAALGLADNVPSLLEEIAAPAGERVVVARCAPSVRAPSAWAVYSGNVWASPWIAVLDGTPLDVAEVSTVTYPRGTLARASTLAACVTTAGTWFYALDELAPAALNLARWGDGFVWDTSAWGGYPSLYVNLGGDSPDDEIVTVSPEVIAATRSLVLPTLAATDELGGVGTFDAWTAGAPDGWTGSVSGDGAITQAAGFEGGYSAELSCGRTKDETKATLTGAALTLVAGDAYHAQGYYLTDDPALRAMLTAVSTEVSIDYRFWRDGRHVVTLDDGIALAHTGARWRYASFLFLARDTSIHAPGASSVKLKFGANKSGDLRGDSARVRFDGWTLRRVRRFARAHGRIAGDVSLETGITSATSFGGKTIGGVELSLSNADGAFDRAAHDFTWAGSSVAVEMLARRELRASTRDRHGRFLTVSRAAGWRPAIGAAPSDARAIAAGVVQEPVRTDDALSLRADEFRALLYERRAAARTYPSDLDPDMDPRIAGRARPVALGTITEVDPARIGKTADGVGVYELADPRWSGGLYALDSARLYADSDAASRRDANLSLELLDVPGALTQDLAECKIAGATPLKPFVLDTEHEYLTIVVEGVTYDLRLLVGSETEIELEPTANGTDDGSVDPGFQASGAASVWQAVVGQSGGYARNSSSTPVGGRAYMTVTTGALPSVTSVVRVTIRALVNLEPGTTVPEEANGGIYLYPKIGGTRYPGALIGVWNIVAGAPVPVEAVFDLSPATSAPWTEAEVNSAEWGVEWYRGSGPNTVSGYVHVDRLRPVARVFLAALPSASAPGICIPLTIASRLQAEARRQLGPTLGPDFSVTLDAENKILMVATGGIHTFDILTKTGRQKSMAGWLGYDTSDDHTGTLSYQAERAIYDPAADIDTPFLRCAIRGYRDDASGTYTGAPLQLIERDADVTRFLCVEFFSLPASWLDAVSFAAARTRDNVRTLALYIADERTVADMLSALESAALADVVFVPSPDPSLPVLVRFVPFSRAADGTEPHITDAGWLRLGESDRRSDQAATVEVKWGRSVPLNGTRSATDPEAAVVRRVSLTRTVETDLATSEQAQAVADLTLPLVSGPGRVSGVARGLLLRSAADRIRATRRRSGLDGALLRLESVKHSLRAGTSEIVAVRIDQE